MKPMPCMIELSNGVKIEVKPVPLSVMSQDFQEKWTENAIKQGWIVGKREPCADCEKSKK